MPTLRLTPGHSAVRAVGLAMRTRCGVGPGEAVMAAVSGGADSVALLRIVHTLAASRRWRLRLHVAHVQHHLRDTDGSAEGDAAFVAELARSLGLPFHRADLDPSRWTGNVEAAARRGRYAALDRLATEQGCRYVAVAHHGEDQWETILLRLMRGAGVAALSGMAWRRRLQPNGPVRLIRPMLSLDRAMVLDLLASLDQTHRHDATNDDTARARARLRRDVVPVLRELSPRLAQRAVDLTDHLRDLDAVLRSQVGVIFSTLTVRVAPGVIHLDTAGWADLPRLLRLSVLRGAAAHCDVPADRTSRRLLQQVDACVMKQDRRPHDFTLPGGVTVGVRRERLAMQRGSG